VRYIELDLNLSVFIIKNPQGYSDEEAQRARLWLADRAMNWANKSAPDWSKLEELIQTFAKALSWAECQDKDDREFYIAGFREAKRNLELFLEKLKEIYK
jgi:hypothetical protein